MNREIKFRIWNGVSMEYNIIAGKFGTFYVNPGKKGDGLNESDSACLTTFNTKYSDQAPVMQFTGLKDKYGVEIYEGDIVRYVMEYGTYIGPVEFEDGMFLIQLDPTGQPFENDVPQQSEVIGNIYENPELIK